MAELKRRMVELQQQSAVHEQEIARLRHQVAALEAGGLASASAGREERAPITRTEATTSRPARAGTVEESDLEPSTVEPLAPEPAAHAAVAESAVAAAPVGEAAQRVYDEAYTLYHQGRYDEAEDKFETFLGANPGTELSDNAQYWVGAARFARADYRAALAAFRRTVERFPEGNKVPDALFKIGQCLEQLGEPAEALDIYEELVERYPETAAATLATERRSQLADSG